MIGGIKVSGHESFRRRVMRWIFGADRALYDTLVDYATLTEEFAVEGIRQGPKTGILYKRYNPVRTIQASAPGEYPADDLGVLAGSIYKELPANRRSRMEATVGSPLVYALYLEFGTRKMAARPWLRPSFDQAVAQLEGSLAANFRRYTS